jgi:hypothetical protein
MGDINNVLDEIKRKTDELRMDTRVSFAFKLGISQVCKLSQG